MTKPPHTGTQQPGSHPLPAVSGISFFLPAQVSFFIGSFMLLCPLLVAPSEVRQGRVWLALDVFSAHISPQGECWLFPVQLGNKHPGRSTRGTGQSRRLLLSRSSLQSWGCQQGSQCPVPVHWEQWFMQEPLESALAAATHPLPFPLPHLATRHCRGKWLLRAVTIFKSPSSSFVTVL